MDIFNKQKIKDLRESFIYDKNEQWEEIEKLKQNVNRFTRNSEPLPDDSLLATICGHLSAIEDFLSIKVIKELKEDDFDIKPPKKFVKFYKAKKI